MNYFIGYSDTREQYIQCLTCNLKSYNKNDIKEKYCGHCHKFHYDNDKCGATVTFGCKKDHQKIVDLTLNQSPLVVEYFKKETDGPGISYYTVFLLDAFDGFRVGIDLGEAFKKNNIPDDLIFLNKPRK